MSSNRIILIYWTKENNWSIQKETSIKEGSLIPGSAVQANFLRNVYPAILIAISENKSAIERTEAHFKKFLLGINAHVDDEEEMIKKIKNEFIPFMTDTPVHSTKGTATPKMDVLVPVPSMAAKQTKSAATLEMMAMHKIAPPKMATPEKATHNKSARMDVLIPHVKGSNEETDYFKKETESNNSRDRRIRKLEDDVKFLQEDNKHLRRKLRKLEERNSLQEVNLQAPHTSLQAVKLPSAESLGECSSVSAPLSEATDDEIKKSVQHLRHEQDVFKSLCLKIFTNEELKNCSRTGKKTVKCGDTVRPPLDVQKLTKLKLLVFQCTAMDKDKFFKKLENLQKILRRS